MTLFLILRVKQLLTKDCTDFIKDLIAKADEITKQDWSNTDTNGRRNLTTPASETFSNIQGLFDTVAKQGGFYGSSSAIVSTVGGRIASKDATVYLAGFEDWAGIRRGLGSFANVTPENMRAAYDAATDLQALTAIHELIHFSYHDVPLARAVASINKDTNATFSYDRTTEASKYWNAELKKHCGPKT